MTGESALLTTAEIAVAFAGFASVVTVFRRREHGWAPQDALRFQLMIAFSLSAGFFSLLPFAISFFGATERTVWSLSSGLLALYLVLSMGLSTRRALSLTAGAALNPYIAWGFTVAGVVTLGLQILNTAGILFDQELGPYFVGVLYAIVLAGVSFARMLPLGGGSSEGERRDPDGCETVHRRT